MDFFNVLSCIGGIALFLFGMTYMGEALKKCAGNQMKNFLTRMTANPMRGFMVGLLVTMVIQSSTATNVMAVSFVNSGMMALGQAVPLMIGSNLGTTVTAWLISLTSIDGASFLIQLLKPASFTAILAFIGIILYRFQSKEHKRDVGAILLGFSILMFGMTTMSGSMSGLRQIPEFMRLFDLLTNPFLGLAVGILMAGIMQSSSASVGVLQALALAGGITFESVIPLILGINIGQVLPVLISSMGTSKNAKRTAVVDLYINVIGAFIALPVYMILRSAGALPFLSAIATPVTIAICHSGYKFACAAILLPCSRLLEKLARITVRESTVQEETLLDTRLMATPSLALAQCRQRTIECIHVTNEAFTAAAGLLDQWNDKSAKLIHKAEEQVDWYQDEIESYLARLSTRSLTEAESKELSQLLHVISNYENISDHIYHMVVSFKRLWETGHSFSGDARKELEVLNGRMAKILELADECFHTEDPKVAFKIVSLEHEIIRECAHSREEHLNRLKQGLCSVSEGCVFTDILLDFERIADHLSKEARLTLVQSYKSRGTGATRFLSALLDKNPEVEERLKRSI